MQQETSESSRVIVFAIVLLLFVLLWEFARIAVFAFARALGFALGSGIGWFFFGAVVVFLLLGAYRRSQ